MSDRNARLVYSTGGGSTCATCGWPLDRCACSSTLSREAVLPKKIIVKLRIEKQGRGGKTVTVLYDLPKNATFLKALAGELKKACGVGGAANEDSVEIQGDQRERIRPLLAAKGWTVKG